MGVLYTIATKNVNKCAKLQYEKMFGKGTWNKLDNDKKNMFKLYGIKGLKECN